MFLIISRSLLSPPNLHYLNFDNEQLLSFNPKINTWLNQALISFQMYVDLSYKSEVTSVALKIRGKWREDSPALRLT